LKGLLRLSTAGSVDDGKSTLIGRLLYDSKGAYDDQVASVTKGGKLDLALVFARSGRGFLSLLRQRIRRKLRIPE